MKTRITGQSLAALRANDAGGGFVVNAKHADFPVVNLTASIVRTGFSQVRLNLVDLGKWDSWTKSLIPSTAGNSPPKNR